MASAKDARPTVTFPAAAGRRRPLSGTKLHCLVTAAQGCGQIARAVMQRRADQQLNQRSLDCLTNVLRHYAKLI